MIETCQQCLDRLWQVFDKVLLLTDKNNCKAWKVRHHILGTQMVIHQFSEHINAYKILCDLKCDNLPTIYDVFSLSDGMIVLEEYIDGITVEEVAQTGHYRKSGAIKVLRGICNAMAVLHQNGIVHRDIKPENIMLDKNGRVCLIDFNASRSITQKSKDTVIMGTIGFAPPEQLGISHSDERTDIYAAGVLLNIMLTGKHPSIEIAKGKLGRIVRKCTNVNPHDRYSSAQKLYNSL